jgi:hypothetical protein
MTKRDALLIEPRGDEWALCRPSDSDLLPAEVLSLHPTEQEAEQAARRLVIPPAPATREAKREGCTCKRMASRFERLGLQVLKDVSCPLHGDRGDDV